MNFIFAKYEPQLIEENWVAPESSNKDLLLELLSTGAWPNNQLAILYLCNHRPQKESPYY